MTKILIKAGPFEFLARMEEGNAPDTCRAFKKLLPFKNKLIHVRWSGEAVWIPLGRLDLGIGYENHTSHPAPGEILIYPGGISETEILFPYGGVRFASKVGQLAGNHFLTIEKGKNQLVDLGYRVLWHGAQDVCFEVFDTAEKNPLKM